MIIDTHIHLVGATRALSDIGDKIKRVEDGISFVSRYPDLWRARLTDEPIDISSNLLEDMDHHNIDRALVQLTPGRGDNDMLAEMVKQHPDRFHALINTRGLEQGASGSRSPWDLPTEEGMATARARAAEEIQRCVEEYSMVGLAETGPRGFSMETHPEKIARDMKPFMDVAARYSLPVQFPTGWTQFPGGMYFADPVWTDEIAGRYPQVPVILTKMGRGLHHFETALSVAMRNVNVYFDTVGTIGEHVRIAVDTIGADRIMFGSDWSATWRWLSDPSDLYTMRKNILDNAKLSAEEREQIEWRTASRVFRLGLE